MGSAARSEFPPHTLREYALLADGVRGAVLGPRGDVVWLCAPRWDSPAVVSTLVGGDGAYAVTPTEPYVWGGYYEPGTLIWRSRWVTTSTAIECREALVYPGDPHRAVLLRRIEATDADALVDVVLDLRADFGDYPMVSPRRDRAGFWLTSTGPLRVRWSGAEDAVAVDGELRMRLRVPAGSHHDLVLEVSDRPLPQAPPLPPATWDTTETAWKAAVPAFDHTVAPRDARHSYAVMRGLTAAGGGMVAAATLGMPERAEAGRNYDYRYVWLRDQAYAGLAAGLDDPLPLLDDAVSFTTARLLEHGDRIAPAYRVDGGPLPHQSTLGLPGYPGGNDVVGNWVTDQFQLDAVGECVQLLVLAAQHEHLNADGHRALLTAVDTIDKRWNEPEAGIWELDNRWWTHSRLACVAGLRTAAQSRVGGDPHRLDTLADAILTEATHRCLAPDGSWLRSPGHAGTDAALLLPPVRGALPADDARTRTTLHAVGDTLTEDGYVYRFAPEDGQALGRTEGAFVLCGLTMSLAHWHQGDMVGAFRWFERNRAACGPPGIFTEEFDVRQRQLRGNFPQAFVHAMFLECCQRLTRSAPAASS